MDWKDTLLDYNEALILSHYSEQLERFAGEDGMKLWWAELLVFLNKQAEISFKAGQQQSIEERKRIGEWLSQEYLAATTIMFDAIKALKRGELPSGA